MSRSATRVVPAEVDVRRIEHLGAWAGLAFALLGVGWVAVVVQGPALSDPPAYAQEYLADNAAFLRALRFAFLLVVLFLLLPFTVTPAERLSDATQRAAAGVLHAGVVLSVMALFTEFAVGVTLSVGTRAAELGSAEFAVGWDHVRVLVLTGFHLTTGLWVAAASIGVLRSQVAPRWVGWLGVALLVPQVVAASWVVGGEVTATHDGLAAIAFIGSFLVWIPAVSLAMLRSWQRTDVASKTG